jgi:hypothetical protein
VTLFLVDTRDGRAVPAGGTPSGTAFGGPGTVPIMLSCPAAGAVGGASPANTHTHRRQCPAGAEEQAAGEGPARGRCVGWCDARLS